jgi:predicted nucleic acid-binding protein
MGVGIPANQADDVPQARVDESLIHLDTGFLIRATKRGSTEYDVLRNWVARGLRIEISVIAWSEFLCGPIDDTGLELATRIVGDPQPLLIADAKLAAEFFNLSGRRRGHLADCMIAATAVRLGAALATINARDFRDCRGLRMASDE